MNENQPPSAGDGSRELLLFQMGPVQEFIAQAATPSDLWAGSYLLSDLILAGINAVPDYSEGLVFPNLKDGSVLEAMKNKSIPTIPNRFLAFVPKGEGAEVARKADKAVCERLDELVRGGNLPPGAKVQADQFLQTFWAILENPSPDMGKNYAAIGKRLAARRSVREFKPWVEDPATKRDGRNGPKDFLSGKETALVDIDGLGRGAMNLLKMRLAVFKKKDKMTIQTKDDKYLAVIALDGDKMGATLSGLADEPAHRDFSKRLAEFAMSAEGMMPENGVLLYAGGDDVLAVVPAKTAIDTAKNLSGAFAAKMKEVSLKNGQGAVSASAGIAVGHAATPLLDLVHAAQDAEHRAKNDYGRNALALSVLKRSGETLQWGCKWDSAAFALHSEIVDTLKDELSARFPYKLAAFLSPYELSADTKAEMEPVVMKELEHVWERSSKENSPARAKAEAYLHETFGLKRPQDFLNLFLCETFINRQRAEED